MDIRVFTLTFLVVVCLASSGHADGIIEDSEPNDTLPDATPTGIDGTGEVLVLDAAVGNGPLGPSDRDLYSFEIGSSNTKYLLTATMVATDEQFDGYLRLFDEDGAELINVDDGETSLSPILQTYLLKQGNYYIGVSNAQNPAYDVTDASTGRDAAVGDYVLSIEVVLATVPDNPNEPNDDEPTIIESLPATLVNQFIGDGPNKRLDVDRYAVEVAGPSIVTGEVRPVQLKILDPIVNGVYQELRSDLRVRRFEFAVYEPGLVEVVVMGTPFASMASVGRSVGFYNFTIDVIPVSAGPVDGPLEPNDSLNDAVAVELFGPGSVTYPAQIGDGLFGGTRGDVDFFEITTAGSETFWVDVLPVEGGSLRPVVRLYDYWGARLESWHADASGSVHAEYHPPPADDPQTYGVAVMGIGDRLTMDPLVPAPDPYPGEPEMVWPDNMDSFRAAFESLDGGPGSTGGYEVTFTIFPTLPAPPPDSPESPAKESSAQTAAAAVHGSEPITSQGNGLADAQRIFATQLDTLPNAVISIDPATGETLTAFPAPEVPLGGANGLAYDGTDLYLLGQTGWFPYLYRLDPTSGEILERVVCWFGSGFFGEMAILGETLYVVDLLDHAIFALPKTFDGPVKRLGMGGLAGISLFGPIVAAEQPNRLYVPFGEDPHTIIELNAEDGLPISTFTLSTSCLCNADMDGDGDVDDDDVAFWEECDVFGVAVLECFVADLDCDSYVLASDQEILECQYNGPGMPPNTGCCPEDLPNVDVRATSLASAPPHVLVAGDWTLDTLERYDRHGQSLGPLPLEVPVGSMTGLPLAQFGDGDGDGDVDLRDWGTLQDCFGGADSSITDPACLTFDYDLDGDVDVDDFAAFQGELTGVEP